MTEKFKQHWSVVETEFGDVLVWVDQEGDEVNIHSQAYSTFFGASLDYNLCITLNADAKSDLFDILERHKVVAANALVTAIKKMIEREGD